MTALIQLALVPVLHAILVLDLQLVPWRRG